MQQTIAPSALGFLGNLPVANTPEVERAPLRIVPQPEVKTDSLFLETLRANLHASARHAALGHTGPSFRECSRPACVEAAHLLPEMDPTHDAATEAELEAILDEVLTGLEREGMSFLAPKPS